jgi:O-antigen ligase
MQRHQNKTRENYISWLAYGLIITIYLSIPLGTKVAVWFALIGSMVGWISLMPSLSNKLNPIRFSVDCRNIAFSWIFIGFLYLILHAIQISSPNEIRRLDAPARVLLLSGLIVLPRVANRKLEDYLLPLTTAGIIFGAISLYQLATIADSNRFFGLYDYYNLMALAALVNTVTLLWMLNHIPSTSNKYLVSLGLLGGVVACLLSGTRASWIIIIIFAAYYLISQRENNVSKRLLFLLSSIITVVGTMLLIDSFDARIRSTLIDINNISNGDHSGSIGLRFLMAEMALNKIMLHPIVGNGLSDFHHDIVRWADANNLHVLAMERGFQNSHNQILHWAQSLGIPCALACIYMIIVWPLRVSRGVQDPSAELVKIIILVCLLFFFTEAVLDRHHGSAWYTTQLSLMLGFMLHAKNRSADPSITAKESA